MPKLKGSPPNTLPLPAVLERLGIQERSFYVSSLAGFLNFYKIGKTKLYLTEEVNKLQYWLFVRRGRVALGLIPHNEPLLPPGKDTKAKWVFLDAWFEEDPCGTECSRCGAVAVQEDYGEGQGPIWCPECGVL